MRIISLALLLIAAVMSVSAGLRHFVTPEFMGMLTILAGGFLACGLALAWFLIPLSRGETWSRWAALTIVAAIWLPTLSVTRMLQFAAPAADPPTLPTIVILALVVVGVGTLGLGRVRAMR